MYIKNKTSNTKKSKREKIFLFFIFLLLLAYRFGLVIKSDILID
jgi:hypothetical protein